MKFEDQTLHDQLVTLDGHEYARCVFMNCDVLFTATMPLSVSACEFKDCRFSFGGAAALTLNALAVLYHGGFKALVEDTFRNIAAGAVVAVELKQTAPLGQPESPSFVDHSCNWAYTLDGHSALGHSTLRPPGEFEVTIAVPLPHRPVKL